MNKITQLHQVGISLYFSQSVLDTDMTKMGRFTAANFSHCTFHVTFFEHLPVEKKCNNIFRAPILHSNFI